MSYIPPFMGSFRDPFYGDMWQDFEEPEFEWGFVRAWVRRRSGNFVGVTNPWGFSQLHVEVRDTKMRRKSHPQSASDSVALDQTTDIYSRIYCEPRQVPTAQRKWSRKIMNEKVKQDEQSSTYPESASDRRMALLQTRPQSASHHFAPFQTTEISCEHRPVPTAQKKQSLKRNEKVKQDGQSSTYPEYPDDSVQSEIGAEEKLERYEKVEGRRSEHQRSCGDLDPVYSADKTEFEAEEKTSRTANCSESSEDMEQLKEHDKQRRDDKHKTPVKQEHEPENDAANKEDCEAVSSKISAINNELSKAKELLVQVQSFSGVRTDKEYLCLEELLLRCILSLDLVETEGCDEVKAARRAAVKEIQSVISKLEAKV